MAILSPFMAFLGTFFSWEISVIYFTRNSSNMEGMWYELLKAMFLTIRCPLQKERYQNEKA